MQATYSPFLETQSPLQFVISNCVPELHVVEHEVDLAVSPPVMPTMEPASRIRSEEASVKRFSFLIL